MTIRDLVPWSRSRPNALARHDSDDPFMTLRDEMNRLFDVFNSSDPASFALTTDWAPRVNVTENEKALSVTAELPGIDEKDIDVTLAHGVLTIKGEKKDEREEKGKNYFRSERSFGSFQRSIALPCEVDENKIDAQYKKGVLSLTLPKALAETEKVRKIAVKAS